MASLEGAYEIRDSVRYLAVSQELVPGHSWRYQQILGGLRVAPDQLGADLARSIVAEYVQYYQKQPPAAGDVTKVAIDLGKVSSLTAQVNPVVGALLANLDVTAPLAWTAQEACFKAETRNGARQPNKFNYHLWDVGTLMQRLAAASTQPQLRSAAQSLHDALLPGAGAVLAEGHVGNWFDGIAGTSIYFVRTPARVSPHYPSLAFAKDTRWGEYVQAYRDFYA